MAKSTFICDFSFFIAFIITTLSADGISTLQANQILFNVERKIKQSDTFYLALYRSSSFPIRLKL